MTVRRDAGIALIVHGLQNDLFHPDGLFARRGLVRISDQDRALVVAQVNAIVAAMRETGRPVVHAVWQLRPDHLDASYAVQWRRLGLREAGALVRGSWGASLYADLTVGEEDFFLPLASHSAFQFTALDRMLRNCGVSTCVLVGGPANEGVDDTARQGGAYGYSMEIVADAIYPLRDPHLATLSSKADVIETAALLERLRSTEPADSSTSSSTRV